MQNANAIIERFTDRAAHYKKLAEADPECEVKYLAYAKAFETAAGVARVNCMLDTALRAGQSVLPAKLKGRWERLAGREVLKAKGA